MHPRLQSALLALALIVSAVGMTACAKYPVVTDTRASSPSAAAPAPSR